MPPRAPTAYFIFAGEVREDVQREVAEQNDGKAPVGLVGKAIGKRWSKLTDEEKQKYKDLSQQKAQALKDAAEKEQAEREERRNAGGEEGVEDGLKDPDDTPAVDDAKSAPNMPPFGLPTGLVKRLAMMDPEVLRIKAEGTQVLAKSTQLFLELLAKKAYLHAVGQKRKNFKFSDIVSVSKRDRRFIDMGLGDFFENDGAFADVHERILEEANSRAGAKRDGFNKNVGIKKDAENTKPLTSFFAQRDTNAINVGQTENMSPEKNDSTRHPELVENDPQALCSM